MNRRPNDMQSLSLHLWRQALSGDPEGAMLALEQMDGAELTVLSGDLLARLYVRVGRHAEARALWQRVLQADPNYSPAVKALNKLDSFWFVSAVAKRFSLWFGVAVLFIFALYGIGASLLRGGDGRFELMGMATILAVLAAYLAGLFGWVCMTAVSVFGPSTGVHSPQTQSGRSPETEGVSFPTSAPRYQE